MTEENIKQEEQEEIVTIDAEQLQELMGSESDNDKLPPIIIEMEDYNMEEFQRGIDETSYLCGQIVSLLNTGVSEQFVSDLILNRETIAHNLETARINKDTSIAVSKNQRVTMEKQEL